MCISICVPVLKVTFTNRHVVFNHPHDLLAPSLEIYNKKKKINKNINFKCMLASILLSKYILINLVFLFFNKIWYIQWMDWWRKANKVINLEYSPSKCKMYVHMLVPTLLMGTFSGSFLSITNSLGICCRKCDKLIH